MLCPYINRVNVHTEWSMYSNQHGHHAVVALDPGRRGRPHEADVGVQVPAEVAAEQLDGGRAGHQVGVPGHPHLQGD